MPSLLPDNGLLTNDKYCMSRFHHLTLRWSGRPLRLRHAAPAAAPYPPGESTHQGGAHETLLAHPPAGAAGPGRRCPLGPRLSAPAELDDRPLASRGEVARTR
jgi:hypothetical protein